MKKLIGVVAVFLAVIAVNANAAQLTVANTELTLAGGITASYNSVSDRDDSDYFNIDTAIVHLFKNPTVDSPAGGHFALGVFDVKLVTGEHVTPDIGYGEFSPWLGYFSWMPVENLTIDAGLLWHKFGEPPITILNPHVTRPVAFMAQPVCFAGARIGYDAGILKFYAGMNDGSALDAPHGNKDGEVDALGNPLESDRAFEVGASAKIAEMVDIAVNYFDHDEGYDTLNASIGTEIGMFHAKLEANYVTADTNNSFAVPPFGVVEAPEDDATTYALYLCAKFSDNFKLPVRFEVVDDNDSGIYGGLASYDGWNVAITPTYNPTKNSFIRVEGVYASDDDDVFADDDGVAWQEDSRTSVIAEFGLLF